MEKEGGSPSCLRVGEGQQPEEVCSLPPPTLRYPLVLQAGTGDLGPRKVVALEQEG